MPISNIPSTYRGMKRLKQISSVFIRHGFNSIVSKMNIGSSDNVVSDSGKLSSSLSTAQRTRMAFEELGPTFIKLGQMLSLEPDIIPSDFVEEFKRLQDDVPSFSFADVESIIESEFGKKTGELFRHLEKEPIAAASISQVHFGELFSGEMVAIKVQRPNIEESIREDVKILKRVAIIMEKRLKNMDLLNPVAIVGEFESFITKEIDFTNEAANIERFSSNFKDYHDICVPNVYWDFITPRVLTMERLDGLSMDEKEKMEASGLDPENVAKIGLNCFAKQLLEHGYFHADPHPGNSLALPDGRVGIIDFGIMGFIDHELMRNLANIFIGYAEHDYERLITVFMNMDLIDDDTDLKSFRYDLIELSEPFYGRSLGHVQVKDVFDKVLALVIKYRIRLPRELILLFKTMVALEGMGKKLSPNANILETMKPYAMKLLMKANNPKGMADNLKHDIFNYANLFKNTPELIHKVLRNAASGTHNAKMSVDLKFTEFDKVEKGLVFSLNRLTMGLVAGTSVMAGSMILGSEHQSMPISISALGVANFPLTTLLGLISYTVATFLGIWLVLSIMFSKR